MTSEKYERVEALAVQLMEFHGLDGWRFRFNNRVRTLGLCRYTGKVIEISRNHAIQSPIESIIDTLKHECAHALVGPGYAHGPVWKAKAIEIGAKPNARACERIAPEAKFRAQCQGCGQKFGYFKVPRYGFEGRYCRKCGPTKGLLTFKRYY